MARKKKTEESAEAVEVKVDKKPKEKKYICVHPKLTIAGRKVPYNEPFDGEEWFGPQFKTALRIGAIKEA